jgi:hypothetical protein
MHHIATHDRRSAMSRLLLGFVLLPIAATIATACSSPVATSPDAAPTGAPGVSAPGSAAAGLPTDFPVPPGASIVQSSKLGTIGSAIVHVDDAHSAFDFWNTALPAAGYKIIDSTQTPDGGLITYSSSTHHGSVAVSTGQAAILCTDGPRSA